MDTKELRLACVEIAVSINPVVTHYNSATFQAMGAQQQVNPSADRVLEDARKIWDFVVGMGPRNRSK